MHVAVLGGGIAGLTSAYRLCRAGVDVSLFEASDRLGGLGASFAYKGFEINRFYHVILDDDSYLLSLIGELGLANGLKWSETKMGFCVRGMWYPFNTPLDLLRFRALGLIDRLRTGFGALYITKAKNNGKPLDHVLAHEWLRRLFGRRVYESIWEPLIEAKFGELRHRIPAYWVWNTLNREKDGSQEVKGCLEGGYAKIGQRLQERITEMGGMIKIGCPVTGIEVVEGGVRLETPDGGETFDAAVSTLPLPLLKRIANGRFADQVPLPELDYQGVVNVVLVMHNRLTDYYGTAVVECDFPYQGIVETTRVIPSEWLGGRHLIYLMRYCSADSDAYHLSDEEHRSQVFEGLPKILPSFDAAQVENSFVFRAPHVEPVWTLGYLEKRPGTRIHDTRVYLATTAQAYPMVTSWNTSVKLADDAVEAVLRDDSIGAGDR